MKVYVASSWRNEQRQQEVVRHLRAAGHEVYDFRNPPGGTGFSWTSVAPDWQQWSPAEYRRALEHPVAVQGFRADMRALLECQACVLVQPCGSSAHLELGHAVGAGKYTVALLAEGREAELMLAMVDKLAFSVPEVVLAINGREKATEDRRTAYVRAMTESGIASVECAAKFRGLAVTKDLHNGELWHVTHENTGRIVSSAESGTDGLPLGIAVDLMFELGALADWAAMGASAGGRLWKDTTLYPPVKQAREAAYRRAAAQEGGAK